MALDANLDLTDFFGASATQTGTHPDTVVTFKPGEICSITDTATITPEGLLFALLRNAETNQGVSNTRILETTHSTFLTQRGGDTVLGQNLILKIHSEGTLPDIDVNDV